MKERMDKECVSICNTLNRLPGLITYESCSGHGERPFYVWFRCDNIDTLSRLGRAVDKRYSDGNWEIVLDSCDGNPRGCFWLRTKSILPNDELHDSLVNLERSILYWFQDDFDKYFNQDTAIEQPNADNKKLRKNIKPKFKVGDKALDDMMIVTVKDVVYDQKYKEYRYSVGSYWVFESALKPYKSHYDIANFKAGMPVLVRGAVEERWTYVLFSHSYVGSDGKTHFNAGGWIWNQCIPFEGNETLLGTTDMCNERFINW